MSAELTGSSADEFDNLSAKLSNRLKALESRVVTVGQSCLQFKQFTCKFKS